MGVLKTLLAVVFAVAVTLFAVSNRNPVALELWPLPYTATIDLYAAVLLAMLFGFIVGLIAAWFAGADRRRAFRDAKRQIRDLEKSAADAKKQLAATPAVPASPSPAAPS
jgi:uncharacterized integral membrane protein